MMALEAPLRSSSASLPSGFASLGEMSSSTPDPHLRPSSVQRVSASLSLVSPSDLVGPSPVTSNGTETTEIEDEESEDVIHPPPPAPQLLMLKTNIPEQIRRSVSEESVSVIHAPESFHSWASTEPTAKPDQMSERSLARDTDSMASTEDFHDSIRWRDLNPQAQNLKDAFSDPSRLRSSSTSSLGKIDELGEGDHDLDETDADAPYTSRDSFDGRSPDFSSEIAALRTALQECWTLCNTLANLSSIHRARLFNSSGTPDAHERAWKSCWRLCQRLYDNKDKTEEPLSVQRMNLDLCRDFCQSLFDIRQRQDEVTDSILRVSFELNNHLYSAQDVRTLPEAFREPCWTLAEMLFSLRQNRRGGQPASEELLGSAVQACWELCDIFREGCTSVRPERNTPRASQASFFGHYEPSGRESRASTRSSLSKAQSHKAHEERQRRANILVLGTASDSSRGGRWSSNASNLSGYSHNSAKTSSTATTATAEDSNITRVKILILKAAMIIGYERDSTAGDNKSSMASLQAFVKQLPVSHAAPRGRRATAFEVAKAILYMMHRSSQYTFLRELFRLVFNFAVDEAESRKNVSIVV
ncbi:unnamed protein product [Parascedosporium putredinis]|uniref:DUF7624 domain-containing protein n=1 Tax=Parascedosporium putredinis TaxID=1442378 RepID=A0A9P1H8A7_9PEZI|nr:unnamed protein product [Parascedosporium putredinis]CAI8002018.1 unnamed protein product [Parascedosporium putredinis]